MIGGSASSFRPDDAYEVFHRADRLEIHPGAIEKTETEGAGEAAAAVVCRAAAEAEQDVFGAVRNRSLQHFPDAERGGAERIAFLRPELREAGRSAHLEADETALRDPTKMRGARPAEGVVGRAGDVFAAERVAQHFRGAFAAVGHRLHPNFRLGPDFAQAGGDAFTDLRRA